MSRARELRALGAPIPVRVATLGPPEVAGEAGDEPGIGIAGSESRPLGGGIVLAAPGAGDMGRLAGGMNSAGLGGSMVRVGPVRGGTTGSAAAGSERSDAVCARGGRLLFRPDQAHREDPRGQAATSSENDGQLLREMLRATQPRKVLLPGAGGGSPGLSPAGPFDSGLSDGFGEPVAGGLMLEMIFPETSIGMASVIPDLRVGLTPGVPRVTWRRVLWGSG